MWKVGRVLWIFFVSFLGGCSWDLGDDESIQSSAIQFSTIRAHYKAIPYPQSGLIMVVAKFLDEKGQKYVEFNEGEKLSANGEPMEIMSVTSHRCWVGPGGGGKSEGFSYFADIPITDVPIKITFRNKAGKEFKQTLPAWQEITISSPVENDIVNVKSGFTVKYSPAVSATGHLALSQTTPGGPSSISYFARDGYASNPDGKIIVDDLSDLEGVREDLCFNAITEKKEDIAPNGFEHGSISSMFISDDLKLKNQ